MVSNLSWELEKKQIACWLWQCQYLANIIIGSDYLKFTTEVWSPREQAEENNSNNNNKTK
eukprot:9233903-Ditylum_brightwellii.AAC.1